MYIKIIYKFNFTSRILPAGFYQQDFTIKKMNFFNNVNLNQVLISKKLKNASF